MKPQITSLPQVTLKELEDEFDKLKGEKAEPIRYINTYIYLLELIIYDVHFIHPNYISDI